MDQKDAVDGGIRQRQRKCIDQRRQRRPGHRPFRDPLRRRHEGDAALAVLAEQPEIGRGIAEAEHPLALRARPARVNAAIDQPPGHDAEALRIKIAEVDDIDGHVLNLTRCRASLLPEYPIALEALTPYFIPI